MTAEQLMEKYNLTGLILEPAPYYWERVKAAINEALQIKNDAQTI